MKKYPQHIVVEIIFEYWVKGLSQQKIADKITRNTSTKITQIELSQLLRDYGFGAQHGKNRGKLRYLQSNLSENDIKAKLQTLIFGRNLRRIEEFETAFSDYSNKIIITEQNLHEYNKKQSSDINNSSNDSFTALIIVTILSFFLLNWLLSFPWWIDVIVSLVIGNYVSKKID